MREVTAKLLEDYLCWSFDCFECGADHKVGIEDIRKADFVCSECGESFRIGEPLQKVVIHVSGGIAHCIEHPNNIAVEIRDYDVDGVDEKDLADDGAVVTYHEHKVR